MTYSETKRKLTRLPRIMVQPEWKADGTERLTFMTEAKIARSLTYAQTVDINGVETDGRED
jgi:hypothetical protein